ncbi:hypothetical protein [uncultured Methanobrevibacter sp.]|uniref:hypothetical protein n=1 Tax=uncultured Methanobrevibacter sp. TaxID=253161 RepID=UPI0026152BDE|nr:hypothetical protein [uncultured Methanobrevibacter sp.]
MSDNRFNSMKGIFNRNQNGNSPKNRNIKKPKRTPRKNQQMNNLNNDNPFVNFNKKQKQSAQNQNVPNQNIIKQNAANIPNQRELSEMDTVLLKHMRAIEKEIGKLVADVQYLDSKNPVVSSEMNKILVELITNAWTIGNIVTTYQEQNELDKVTQFLSEHEKRILSIMENPNKNSPNITNELNEVRTCQKIINDSIRPINSTAEYYNLLMSKLSNWGFEVKNPIGQKYDVHMDMDILAFEDADPNLEVPIITETKKPEIYLNGNKLARAQVIVTKAGAKK